jgi:hypothetical protein
VGADPGLGMARPRFAVTFIQRFGDALNLNVHFHMLALDGVYAEDTEGRVEFHRVLPPSDAEVDRVAERVHGRVGRLLKRRGLHSPDDGDPCDEFQNGQPLLAELYGASILGRAASDPRAGRRTAKIGDAVDVEDLAVPYIPRCATVAGFNVHANVGVPGRDRLRLERLCRYAGRPPVATERLSRLSGGKLLYRLKRRWRDGTTHLIFEPLRNQRQPMT